VFYSVCVPLFPTISYLCLTVLDYFVRDDKDLGIFAYERGSLKKLSKLVESMTPTEKTSEWDDEESDHISSLREVVISFFCRSIGFSLISGSSDRDCSFIALEQ
jgi:uncharacterized UPF0160 family protein